MPRDLPGFYYDVEKNRYFPLKGPIPGSSHKSSSSSSSLGTAQKPISKSNRGNNLNKIVGIKTAKLLQLREFYGKVITSNKGKHNFCEEYQKKQASKPTIWKYHDTHRIGDGALEQIHVDIDTPNGVVGTDILLAGGVNGSLSLYEVGKVGQQFDYSVKCIPDQVRPHEIERQARCMEIPGHLWGHAGASTQMPSNITSIKMFGKHSTPVVDDAASLRCVLVTTLGSGTSGGSICIVNLNEPVDFSPSGSIINRTIYEVTSFNYTVWTADCNSNGSLAVIGTNVGAASVDIESGRQLWVCRCKSDILSLQLDRSGSNVLCGLRNGALITVDTRKKSLKGNMHNSHNIFMPSSISSLALLQLHDQYFLASSMDGSIRLYDQRLMQRGPVQSYEGCVNSHTRIHLGVDPSERFFMSGGEDCKLRFWDIKSGKQLYEDKFMNSVPSIVCWPRAEVPVVQDERENCINCRCRCGGDPGSSGVWLGSAEGIFHVRWPTMT